MKKHLFLLPFAASVALGAFLDDDSPSPASPRGPHGALSGVTASRAPAPPTVAAPIGQIARKTIPDYASVGFDELAGFEFKAPEIRLPGSKEPLPDVMAQVPSAVRALDGKKVIITGFMLPVKIEKGMATEFLLMNSQLMCCFGATPATNAWIAVKMPKGVPAVQDVPIAFCGRLHVKPTWENGWLSNIYQLEGEGSVRL